MAQMTDSQREVLIHIQTNVGNSIEQILKLDKELNSLNDTMSSTKDELSKVDDAFRDGKMSEADYEKETARLKTELESLNAQVKNINSEHRAYRKELENAVKAYESNDGSIKQMRAELSNLRKQYEALSKVEREGAKGTDMLTKIQTTTVELKRLEEAQGDFRRSVGNYQRALEGVSPTLTAVWHTINGLSGGTMDMNKAVQNAIPIVKNFGKQLLALAKNPIVLAIVAVVGAMKALVEQFKRTDDAMTALQELFASLSPIMETFRGILGMLVNVITKTLGGITKLITGILSLVPGFREASESARQLVRDLDDLEEKERKYGVEAEKNNIKIAKLRNKAAESDKYTAEDRKKALEEALKLEKKNAEMEAEVAQEKYRLAVADAARRNDTSDETKNTINDLEKQYLRALANAEDATRKMRKQIARYNAEARNETVNTWKTIMGSDAYTVAERKKADSDMEKMVEKLRKRADTWAKMAADARKAGNMEEAEEIEATQRMYQEEYEDMAVIFKTSHKSMVDSMKSDWMAFRNNEKEAQRAYEDAILASMDETLDKQLQLVENEYKREIADLKFKLQTEEKLTAEARDYINKLILEKERKLNETLILTQAQYWATVREDARTAMDEIMRMNAKLMSADPGRVGGAFAEIAMEQIRNAAKEFDEQSTKLTKSFESQYNAMNATITRALDDNLAALNTILKTEGTAFDEIMDKPKTISKNVVDMMTAMRDKSQEFANGATKNLEAFMQAVEAMRKRIGMTNDEYNEMFEILKPFLANINTYYQTLMSYPQKFTTYMSNLVYNQVKNDAERIRKAIIDNMDFRGLVENDANSIIKEIDKIDRVLIGSTKNWENILRVPLGAIGSVSYEDLGLDKAESNIFEFAQKLVHRLEHKFTWNVDFELPDDFKSKLDDMAKKYGEEFDSSFSGVLEHLSGSDDINQQMEYLVKNYEYAINQIEQINKDFQEAYTITGDEAFKNAMIDEAVITSQLRRIYDLAKRYGKDYEDWEADRLEIQGRYAGEADRELKVRIDLLDLEQRRMKSERQGYQNQLDYIYENWDLVYGLEKEYNKLNLTNTQQISVLQQQLQTLKDEASTFGDGVSPEIVEANAKATADIEAKIQQLTEATKAALQALAQTGFMSTEEMEEAAKELEKNVMAMNNNIVENTAQQAAATTSIWLNSFTRLTGGLGQLGSAFNSLFSEIGELNDEWNAFAEASAYFTIGVNMAEGIAEAVAAGAGVPFPANLAAIASGIAAVISGIASATSVYNQYHKPASKFADGGLIGGRYAKTKVEGRRDDIDIKASRGEYVINAESVKKYGVRFLDRINYGRSVTAEPKLKFADGGYVTTSTIQTANEAINMDNMRTIMAEAMAEIQPVVSVREITKAQNRVKVAERVSKR